jgi:hypothetical protein
LPRNQTSLYAKIDILFPLSSKTPLGLNQSKENVQCLGATPFRFPYWMCCGEALEWGDCGFAAPFNWCFIPASLGGNRKVLR